MMKVDLYNQAGEVSGNFDLPDKVFGLKLNHQLVKQVLEAQLANARPVLAHAKGRGEVRGGGRKPWRQKGTGRARHASIRSPIWKGGGVTFGPTKERNFSQKINKKMKRQALFMVLSSKFKDHELLILDNLLVEDVKTKTAFNILKTITSKLPNYRRSKRKSDSVLVVTPQTDRNLIRALGNIPATEIDAANNIDIRSLLANKYLILLKDAIPVIEKTYKF